MADIYRSGSSRGETGAGSGAYRAPGASRADYPTYDAGSRATEWDDLEEDYDRRSMGSRVDDLVPVLGIVLGGAVGYMLATMVTGDSSRSGQGSTFSGSSGRGYSSTTDARRGRSSRSVEHDETTDLIASNKVEGTAVYDRQGEKLGEVHNFMVGKRSGRVAYAVMSLGGLLGIGQRYHALPWNVLTYDTNRGGYVIDANRDILMNAPTHQAGEEPFSSSDQMRRIREYWSSGRAST
jgi:hypothetical protein